MAADVVGFSKLMGADEAATLAAFGEMRQTIFEPMVARHHGEVIKRIGDGWLVEFASSLDAVNCAIATQKKLTDHAIFKLRIGIHLGDIVHDDEGDIHGDGVNVAARLEAIAPPCGIAISDQVYNSLDGTMTSAFVSDGERDLKNIARRLQVWNWPSVSTSDTATKQTENITIPVILLEPFSIGGDEAAATDVALEVQSGLLDALSNRSGVRVTTSTGSGDGPTYILKGRCRVSGDRCRLHLSITVVANGETFWTTKIDGKIADLFGFVDEVVGKVGAAMRVHINAYAGAVYASQPDEQLTEQQLLAKAAYLFHHFDATNTALSRKTMNFAVAKSPESPMALAMQSYAMMQTVPLFIERAEDMDIDTVMSLADSAVYHGPNVDFVFHNRARIRLWLRGDLDGCAKDAKRALAINSNYHLAYEDLALVDIFGGNALSGAEKLEKIIEQVPAQPNTPYRLSILGIGYAIAGDMAAAVSHALDGYERKPLVPLHALAYAAAVAGDKTIVNTSEFKSMVQHHKMKISDAHRFPFARQDDTTKLATMLQQSGVPE